MGYMEQIITANRIKNEKIAERTRVLEERENVIGTNLSEVKGIGPATLQKLVASGIKTKEQLEALSEEEIKTAIGNPLTAKSVIASLRK